MLTINQINLMLARSCAYEVLLAAPAVNTVNQ